MTFDAARATGCPPLLDGGIDVETWAPRPDTEFIRFVNTPAIRFARAAPITLPVGLRGSASRFSWSRAKNFEGTGQRGQLVQSMGLQFSVGDAGVEGFMALQSNYVCTAFCDPAPRYDSCDTRVPVKLEEVDLAPFPIEDSVPDEKGETMMTVALSSSGSCADGFEENELQFERWSFTDEHVRLPTRSGNFGSYVDSKFAGVLDLAGDLWFWTSDVATLARPRATVALPVFDLSKGDAFDGTMTVEVMSNCTSDLCPARACRQSLRLTAMREEKKP